MNARSPITTHVLDTAQGRPAAGIAVVLHRQESEGEWSQLGSSTTNQDGRIEDLLAPGPIDPGFYRLTFEIADYFEQQSVAAFYPAVNIEFTVSSEDEHYHVPLLLSPFGYSTYRGS